MPTESTSYSLIGAPSPGVADWEGTARYDVIRCIGKGGMGVVYEAFDRERKQHVALKTLLHFSPSALYLFKQEFRTLADVHHRNLVHLYELVMTETDHVFFTMELVTGTDFLTYVQRAGIPRPGSSSSDVGSSDATHREHPSGTRGSRDESAPRPTSVPKATPADFDHLRPALRQLVEGVEALHAAGKLHRDIKPSNVRVTPDGRLVLLDFGVATELARVVDEDLLDEGEIVGTARYMAPEQAASETPTPACDWYSVGAMLYEALVGTAPFVGSAVDVLTMKSMLDAPSPSESVIGIPADLDALCGELLSRAPEKRPTGPEILRRLEAPGPDEYPAAAAPPPMADRGAATVLVGRDAHRSALRDAFDATLRGRSIAVRVSGRSGMGKSSLVQHFLDELVERGEASVLRGRAYERESVPYKAVDSVIDALSRHLMRLAERDDGSIPLPRDIWALARLFPVLRRVPSISAVPEPRMSRTGAFGSVDSAGPKRIRQRAFIALRELLASLARRQPLVVFVDDVQWGDTDGAALLLELVRPPYAPPLLLVMTYPDEETHTSPFLVEMRNRWPAGAESRDVLVGPLVLEDARRLALALLGSNDEAAAKAADAIARESGGSPFLIEELTRSASGTHGVAARAGDSSTVVAASTLEQMVSERLAVLPEEARRLLEIVAIGGRPLPISVAAEASALRDAVQIQDVIGLVRARRFVRTALRDGREVVETSHDRVREAIVAQLPEARVREHHSQLARVLERTPDSDAEALACHLLGAGERERAAQYAERAAEEAASKLAFDQAVRLFRLTLETTAATPADTRRVRVRLAEVLEWAGRGAEAARVYLDAAEGAPFLDRVELERSGAEQLLTSGRIDEGTVVLHRVLAAVGMRGPRSALSAVIWLMLYRFWLFWVGMRFKERDASDISREDGVRIDALCTVAIGLSVVDVVQGACMQARHLILALRHGDRFRVLRASCLEATHLAGEGGEVGRRERALTVIIERLAQHSMAPESIAFAQGTRGMSCFLRGRWSEARDLLRSALANIPNAARGGWQSNGQLIAIQTLDFLGELNELESRHARLLAEAEERGDLYTVVNLRTRVTISLCLRDDDPDEARRHAREAINLWTHSGYRVQHWQTTLHQAEIDLYLGDGASAYERVARDARALRRSFLLKAQFIRALTAFMRGRAAIASLGAAPAKRRARVAEARRMARRLEREAMPWTELLSSMVEAIVANATGDREGAIAALRTAIERAEATEMLLHGQTARYRLGSLLGGDEGRRLVEQAEQAMAAQGVRAPERMAARMLPGRF